MPVSRPVGGILFPGPLRGSGSVTIHLCGLPEGVRLPGRTGCPCPLLGLAPGWGLPSRRSHPRRWCALTAPFHPHLCVPGGTPSAVCSLLPCTVRSLRPGSRQHPALRSPDLPRPGNESRTAVTRTAHRHRQCLTPGPQRELSGPRRGPQKSSAERSSCQCPARSIASAHRCRAASRSIPGVGSMTAAGDQAAAMSSQPDHTPVARPAR